MKIGYLRVSTSDQLPDRQIVGLESLCDETHIETLSAVAKQRPVFDRIIAELKAGDTFVVLDLDRAFRSTVDAILTAEQLRERGIEFQIVTMNLDTTTPAGEFFYTIMAAYGQFERRNLSRRTKEGLVAARLRGKRLGRPPKMSKRQVMSARLKIDANEATLEELAALNGVHPWTLTRSMRRLANKV